MFCMFGSLQAQTQDVNKIWTTVGSDGTVDETDTGKVFFDRSMVQMGRPLVGTPPGNVVAPIPGQTQSAVIRYNVVPVDGLFITTPKILKLRYLAAGNSAKVIANLIEVDMATGSETVRLTFNSTSFSTSNKYQVQTGRSGRCFRFDFKSKAYYIEATLTNSTIVGGSAAGIQMIKLDTGLCIL
jgi:hypothetical protein